ncbi:MAG: tRNA cytidylyltransferase [Alicyclobacillus sp.]|nr:tRNA cytidylyltransferase [Alicyclobacillus sp.]
MTQGSSSGWTGHWAHLSTRIPEHVRALLTTLETAGFEAYLVGGSVRDLLLGRPVHDFDVTTNARPEEVRRLFSRTLPTGVAHGTVTVQTEAGAVEVTTYRIDLGYSDGRRPDAVQFADTLQADLARRDFTVNAMALDARGQLQDPLDGLSDLKRGVLRAVGDPNARFREDGLRILRGLRLAAQLGFALDSATYGAMTACAMRLSRVSAERIGQELRHIAGADWRRALRELANGPWLLHTLHPIPLLRPVLQQAYAVLVAVEHRAAHHAGIPPLLPPPDIDAPQARDAETWRWLASACLWLYLGRCEAGTAARILRRFAWPKAVVQPVVEALRLRDASFDAWPTERWAEELVQGGGLPLWLACGAEDIRSEGAVGPRADRFRTTVDTLPLRRRGDLAVSGRDLLGQGLQGPAIGHTLQLLLRAVLSGRVPNEPAALLALARAIAEGTASGGDVGADSGREERTSE